MDSGGKEMFKGTKGGNETAIFAYQIDANPASPLSEAGGVNFREGPAWDLFRQIATDNPDFSTGQKGVRVVYARAAEIIPPPKTQQSIKDRIMSWLQPASSQPATKNSWKDDDFAVCVDFAMGEKADKGAAVFFCARANINTLANSWAKDPRNLTALLMGMQTQSSLEPNPSNVRLIDSYPLTFLPNARYKGSLKEAVVVNAPPEKT